MGAAPREAAIVLGVDPLSSVAAEAWETGEGHRGGRGLGRR